MKKPFKFDEIDHDITCANPKCNRPLKKNVLARVTEKILICFHCFTIREYNRGHILNDKALQAAGIKHTFKDCSKPYKYRN